MAKALILGGATGLLGQALVRVLATRGWQVTTLGRQDGNVMDFDFLQSALEIREHLDEAHAADDLISLKQEVQQWMDSLVREFKIDYTEEDWTEARDTVRKLRFFQKVMADIDKAEDRFLDDDSFDLDDDF